MCQELLFFFFYRLSQVITYNTKNKSYPDKNKTEKIQINNVSYIMENPKKKLIKILLITDYQKREHNVDKPLKLHLYK